MGQGNTVVSHFVVQRAVLIVAPEVVCVPCGPRRSLIYAACAWGFWVCWKLSAAEQINLIAAIRLLWSPIYWLRCLGHCPSTLHRSITSCKYIHSNHASRGDVGWNRGMDSYRLIWEAKMAYRYIHSNHASRGDVGWNRGMDSYRFSIWEAKMAYRYIHSNHASRRGDVGWNRGMDSYRLIWEAKMAYRYIHSNHASRRRRGRGGIEEWTHTGWYGKLKWHIDISILITPSEEMWGGIEEWTRTGWYGKLKWHNYRYIHSNNTFRGDVGWNRGMDSYRLIWEAKMAYRYIHSNNNFRGDVGCNNNNNNNNNYTWLIPAIN